MGEYRGPYFRTGIDGSGNYWELDSNNLDDEQKRLSRKPSKWELQKPRRTFGRLTQATPESRDSTTETDVKPQDVHTQWVDDWASGEQSVVDSEHEMVTQHNGDVFISKHYLRDMLMEIWKASPAPPVPASLESTNSLNSSNNDEDKAKGECTGSPDSSTPEVKSSNTNTKKNCLTAREEKMRMFECFEKMSIDPPETPPTQQLLARLSGASISSSGTLKKRTVKKKTKKSKVNSSEPAFPNFDPLYQVHPNHMHYYAQPQEIYGPTVIMGQGQGLPPKPPKKTKSTRQEKVVESGHDRINSTMIVQKVPMVNGWFNDSMLPPMVVPVNENTAPTKKKSTSTKKGFDTYGPLSWSVPSSPYNVDPLRGCVRCGALGECPSPPVRKVKTKTNKVSDDTSAVAPKSKKQNKHLTNTFGPYIDSELDLQHDYKIRPKF